LATQRRDLSVSTTHRVRPCLQILCAFLLSPPRPLWRYCLLAFPVALLPSAILSALAQAAVGWLGIDASTLSAPDREATLGEVFGALVFAPIVETLILGFVLRALSAASSRTFLIAAASGIAWGCLHALFGFLWFFGPAWSFFVFSCGYLAWRKHSFRQAFIAAAVPHALINATVMLTIAVFG